MTLSRKLLNQDEHIVVSTRTHVKALLVPALLLVLIAGVAGYLASLAGGDARDVIGLVIWVAAFGLIAFFVIKPVLVWVSTSYTVTNRRLITRSGILTRRGHDIPLIRISDVAYEHGLVDRMLGCGTLVISDASEQGRVKLHDIPHVEQVHLQISDLLHGSADRNTREDSYGDTYGDNYRADDGT